jgi:hypothetical protein
LCRLTALGAAHRARGYPTDPSISSWINRCSSTAYSIGEVHDLGSRVLPDLPEATPTFRWAARASRKEPRRDLGQP